MTVDDLITDVIEREGGFIEHPADRAGATKYGITKATLARWRGRIVTTSDVRSLDVGEAMDIYRALYVSQPGFDTVPEPLRTQLVDFGVHSGPAQAIRALQRAIGVTVDGILGPQTRDALNAQNAADVARVVWQERIRYLAHVIAVRPTTSVPFIDGWLNRCFVLQP